MRPYSKQSSNLLTYGAIITFVVVVVGYAVVPLVRVAMIVLYLVLVVSYVLWLRQQSAERRQRWAGFATAYGLQYLSEASAMKPGIFSDGQDVLSGQIDNHPVQISRSDWRVNDGFIPVEVLQMDLGATLPDFALDWRDRGGMRFARHFAAEQTVSLVVPPKAPYVAYAPRGYEIDVLQFLTPDVMSALAEIAPTVDLEVFGGTLNLFWSVYIDDPTELTTLIAAASKLLGLWENEIRRYRLNLIGDLRPVLRDRIIENGYLNPAALPKLPGSIQRLNSIRIPMLPPWALIVLALMPVLFLAMLLLLPH